MNTRVAKRPADWRGYAHAVGGALALPALSIVFAGAFLHFVHEQRFNRELLFDLVSQPGATVRAVPELAA